MQCSDNRSCYLNTSLCGQQWYPAESSLCKNLHAISHRLTARVVLMQRLQRESNAKACSSMPFQKIVWYHLAPRNNLHSWGGSPPYTILHQETICAAGGFPSISTFWIFLGASKFSEMSADVSWNGPWHWHVTVHGCRTTTDASDLMILMGIFARQNTAADCTRQSTFCANRTSFMWVKDSYWSFVTVLTACHQQSSPSPQKTIPALAPSPESSDWWWTYAKFCCSCREWKTIITSLCLEGKKVFVFESFWRKYYDSIYVVRAPLMLSNVLFEFCSVFSKSVVRKYQCMQRLSTNACSMKQPHFFSIDYKPINVLSMYVYIYI